ncbi:MAG TPA: helix-turn-helix transcriptional regulator [Cyclobacteriaceae bacterium]|nr:helix-turn-helix domain-containing protein [Cyclobacteriaceae bacterium]HMV08752.1 helix-turn-helix transcriptional regulator [Cyclobacteriaceae bacterium]HMV90210.1 helix-turn-helix transcriptional regulator [Cyclobacteriaceae bacterium]HMW99897.1 helix-turn-helix transcriptional regulator [Cyclobacteriaceae bacterium]HMX49240.1 helix-turn-helix transcriptional regulator [Cyclobacteriaceae bacterium]
MQQPELGKRLVALRKEKNLTQEELVEKSHVSVRTIQRIESGEVLPRLSTVKILWAALGEKYEPVSTNSNQVMDTRKKVLPNANRMTVLIAALAGAVYLVSQIVLGTLDVAWFTSKGEWEFSMKAIYTAFTVIMVVSYVFFARGFIALSNVFENALLKIVAYMLITTTAAIGFLDVFTLSFTVAETELFSIPYAFAAILFGTLSIVFGVALIRLQDGMGELSRVAGILEIATGCFLITVILFFVSYVIMIPALVAEILLLYRGYEYLSRVDTTPQASD